METVVVPDAHAQAQQVAALEDTETSPPRNIANQDFERDDGAETTREKREPDTSKEIRQQSSSGASNQLDPEEDMAEKHHQAGFSAQAFASYEERLKTTVAKPLPAHPSRFSDATTVGSFETASDLEKGEGVAAKPSRVRHISAGSLSSVETLNLPIPAKRQSRTIRNLRHTYLNVYRRLFSLAFVGNMIALVVWLARLRHTSVNALSLSDLATAASVNICVAILIRADYIVNSFYHACWLVPHSAPLRLRCMLAKVYENGGLHSGCAVAGSLWFLVLTIVLAIQYINDVIRSVEVMTLTLILLVLLFSIIIWALPGIRMYTHNSFEVTHRFAGWSAVAIFWVDAMLIVNELQKKSGHSFGYELIRLPTFWILGIITFHLVLPWLRLRKWHFQPDQLSGHAVRLNFEQDLPPLSGLAISESPLMEWHPFATYPRPGGGTSIIVSAAGDWTRRTVANPKTRYWIKGLPKTGVLSMGFVFRKIVIVTTGSGIGPSLSFLLSPIRHNTECRLLWATKSPLQTYGHELETQVLEADQSAIVLDSSLRTPGGTKPDMVALAYNLYMESGAEAVFCISNPKTTKEIVYGLETRGVPAFGPIWDS